MCAKLLFSGYILVAIATVMSADSSNSLEISTIFKPEECTVLAERGDEVAVHYILRLKDGTVLKSTYEDEAPTEFAIGDSKVLSGLSFGIIQMCVGEKRKIEVPPALAYGEAGKPPSIPSMAYLDIEAELLQITKAPNYIRFLNDRRVIFGGYVAVLLVLGLIILCKCLPNFPSQKRKAASKSKKTD